MQYHLPRSRSALASFAKSITAALVALTFAAAAADVAAQPRTPSLASELSAERVLPMANGRETLAPAATVSPGDTLEYHARWRNTGTAPLGNVVATLPIPAGTQFAAAGALPSGALASVDGVSFAPMPLQRRVRQADGQWRDVPVPLAHYRAVRWPARTLAAGEQFDARVRVQVIAAVAAEKGTR
jgi:uncharacterized repeat protein (TIGR01451 family)